jgi:hypothetical protein
MKILHRGVSLLKPGVCKMDVRKTPTKKWLKHINLEHLAEVFESNGFETVGAIIAMVIFQPNGLKLGERRLLEQQIRMLKTKVSFLPSF